MNKSLTFVELDIEWCALEYGTTNGAGTCPAVLGVDSDRKCFNSKRTCAARNAYAPETVTLRFAIDTDYRPKAIEAFPCILSAEITPAVVSLGKDLGQRASLNVTFRGFPHSDTGPGFDKYLADRSYNPFEQGTFWAKFRARQPYLRGKNIRIIRGLVPDSVSRVLQGTAMGEDDLDEQETRHYIVDSFDGPHPDGTFEITANDALKLASGDKAQAPVISNGFLAGDINSSTTSATLSPSGIGNAEYPASGYLNIGGTEVVSFTRSNDTLTITRAQLGTTASAHSSQDRCQVVLRYSGEDVADIIYDLLTEYADIDPSYIDLPTWQTETAANLAQVYTGAVTEPTSVEALCAELIEQAGLVLWWDDEALQVRLQVLRAIPVNAQLFDENNILKDNDRSTLRIQEQPDRRLSQVWVYFAQINPLKSLEDTDNYRSTERVIDTDAEDDYDLPAIKKIFSRWIPVGGRGVATKVGQLLLARYRDPPRKFDFDIFRYGPEAVSLGAGGQLGGKFIQDDEGAPTLAPIQITSLSPKAERLSISADEMLFTLGAGGGGAGERVIIFDVNQNSVNLRTIHDTLYAEPVGGETIQVIVNPAVTIGGGTSGTISMDVGTWPTVVRSGNRTASSAVITGLSDTSDLAEGMVVTGTGIPAQTKILSVDSASQITLDANASSGSGTSTSLTFYTVIINIENNGRVEGRGGRGGNGNSGNGSPGQTAFYSRYYVNLENLGEIWGGGGGGGGGGAGESWYDSSSSRIAGGGGGGGGGGGAGSNPGGGGSKGDGRNGFPSSANGSDGSTGLGGSATSAGIGRSGGSGGSTSIPAQQGGTGGTGGNGGGPGAAGSSGSTGGSGFGSALITPAGSGGTGGAAGPAIDGDSFVVHQTVSPAGEILGSQVN